MNKCNKRMDDFDYDYERGRCIQCKERIAIKTGIIVGLIFLLIAIPIGFVQYNYELDKCTKLKVSETNYGFTNTIEVSANYNEECYRLRNHPLVILEYLMLLPLMACAFLGVIGYMIRRFR